MLSKKITELEGVKSTGADYLHTILEMHVDLNLDDYENFDDKAKKIKIPYVVTIDEGSGEILSINLNLSSSDLTSLKSSLSSGTVTYTIQIAGAKIAGDSLILRDLSWGLRLYWR